MQSTRARRWLWACYLLAVAAFALSAALQRVQLCDYVSIDGDFQSYNVFRRVLAGQAPYADFANYIGLAPVVVNLPFLLFHSSFAASLFVTNFSTAVLFCAAVLALVYLASGSLPLAMLVSAALPKLTTSGLLGLLPGGQTMLARLQGLVTPGNSMRMARCFLPFGLVLAALVWAHTGPGRDVRTLFDTPRRAAAAGLVLGVCVLWSNDFGLAALVTATILLLLTQLGYARAGARHTLARLGCFALGAAVGCAACAAVVTQGHPLAWLRFTRAVGGSQPYYFAGTNGAAVLPYILHQGAFWLAFALPLAFLCVQTVRLCRRQLSGEGYLLYFAVACVCAATLAYLLTGSGYNCREPLEVFGALLGLGLLARALLRLCTAHRKTLRRVGATALAVVCLVVCAGAAQRAVQAKTAPRQGEYIPGLGGYSSYHAALVEASEWVGDGSLFSVYATGLEAATGRFQPTGCDYIIHALGPESQAAYLADFTAGEYDFVQTPRLPVDGWLACENWYFYREVLAHYTRTYQTEYSWLWQRGADNAFDAAASVEILPGADGSVTLTCHSARTEDFVVDLHIVYAASFDSAAQRLACLGQSGVDVLCAPFYPDVTSYRDFTLPGAGQADVPVVMTGGEGSITLHPLAMGYGTVQVESATVTRGLPRLALEPAL